MQAMAPPGPSQQAGPSAEPSAQLPGGFPLPHSPFLTAPAFAYMPVSLVSPTLLHCPRAAWPEGPTLECSGQLGRAVHGPEASSQSSPQP